MNSKVRVGLQIGHWNNEAAPDDLYFIRGNRGAVGGGKIEWEVIYAIAQEAKTKLEDHGVIVDLIPAVVPQNYKADVFVSIHADSNKKNSRSGYKFSGPAEGLNSKNSDLVYFLEKNYEEGTGFKKDNDITANMLYYYAFMWQNHENAVDPSTPSVIAETGFLTNPRDREFLLNNPEISGKAIADGIIEFLRFDGLLAS